MWLWSNIVFWACCVTLSVKNLEKEVDVQIDLELNRDFYVEIAMVPFTKNRRFFVHDFDTLKNEKPEWIRARIVQPVSNSYLLCINQKEMKNALKQNANFKLEKLLVDRTYSFPIRKTSDVDSSFTKILNLSTASAAQVSADSIFYKLIPQL